MHPDTLTEINAHASLALDALAKRQTFLVMKLLKEIAYLTSPEYLKLQADMAAYMALAKDLPDLGKVLAEMDGKTIEGTYTRGGVS